MGKERYGQFTFRYVNDPQTRGAVRVYVESQPSYSGRDTNVNTIHRWPANHDGYTHPPYICFRDEFKPTSYEEGQERAHDWAQRTLTYIRTGVTISEQIARERATS